MKRIMKRILCSLLVATLPFGSVLAETPKAKNAKVTLVYQHELPNVPGKSIKAVLVEYRAGPRVAVNSPASPQRLVSSHRVGRDRGDHVL